MAQSESTSDQNDENNKEDTIETKSKLIPNKKTSNDDSNDTSSKSKGKNDDNDENESNENKENEKQRDINVLDMTIEEWLGHLEEISKNGKRKGMEQFREKLIGENGEFEDDATLRDVSEFKRETVERWFKDVTGVSGLLKDLIRVLKPHWNKSLSNAQTQLEKKISIIRKELYLRKQFAWERIAQDLLRCRRNSSNFYAEALLLGDNPYDFERELSTSQYSNNSVSMISAITKCYAQCNKQLKAELTNISNANINEIKRSDNDDTNNSKNEKKRNRQMEKLVRKCFQPLFKKVLKETQLDGIFTFESVDKNSFKAFFPFTEHTPDNCFVESKKWNCNFTSWNSAVLADAKHRLQKGFTRPQKGQIKQYLMDQMDGSKNVRRTALGFLYSQRCCQFACVYSYDPTICHFSAAYELKDVSSWLPCMLSMLYCKNRWISDDEKAATIIEMADHAREVLKNYDILGPVGHGICSQVFGILSKDNKKFALKMYKQSDKISTKIHNQLVKNEQKWYRDFSISKNVQSGAKCPHFLKHILNKIGPVGKDYLILEFGYEIPIRRRANLAEPIFDAMLSLHNAGYTHGDIRWPNILFVGDIGMKEKDEKENKQKETFAIKFADLGTVQKIGTDGTNNDVMEDVYRLFYIYDIKWENAYADYDNKMLKSTFLDERFDFSTYPKLEKIKSRKISLD